MQRRASSVTDNRQNCSKEEKSRRRALTHCYQSSAGELDAIVSTDPILARTTDEKRTRTERCDEGSFSTPTKVLKREPELPSTTEKRGRELMNEDKEIDPLRRTE